MGGSDAGEASCSGLDHRAKVIPAQRTLLLKAGADGARIEGVQQQGWVPLGSPEDRQSAGVSSLVVASDGTITAAGTTILGINLGAYFIVAQLLPDDSLNPDFGYDGTAGPYLSESNGSIAQSIMALDSGDFLVAGSCFLHSGSETFCAVRLGSDGFVDADYGNEGWGVIPFAGRIRRHEISAVLQADGKLVIVGATPDEPPADFIAGRLTAEGQPDPSFGESGISTISFSDEGDEGAAAIALQANRPILAGFTDGGSPGPWGLAAVRLQNDALFRSGFD